jgi:hypothetical protein
MIIKTSVRMAAVLVIFSLAASTSAVAQTTFVPIRLKCAGPAYIDPQGQLWSADPGDGGGLTYSSTAPITGTSMGPLYQSSRSWNSTAAPAAYSFNVPNGIYSVFLKFAETSATQAGQRVFNVLINNQSVVTNFDILASAGGANIALDKQYTVAVSNGEMTIALVSVTGSPIISAIQITSATAQSPYEVVAKFHPAPGATSFSLPDMPIIGTLRVYRNGLLLSDSNDYFLSDAQLWFQPGQSPQVPDLIQVIFKH